MARKLGGDAASAGRQNNDDLGNVGMLDKRLHRPEYDRNSLDQLKLLGRLGAEACPLPRGDDDGCDVTRQVPAPADPRVPVPRATRRALVPSSAKS